MLVSALSSLERIRERDFFRSPALTNPLYTHLILNMRFTFIIAALAIIAMAIASPMPGSVTVNGMQDTSEVSPLA